MNTCPHCQSPLSFGAVLCAMNPARIPCGNCKAKIEVATPAVLVTVTLLLIATLALIWGLHEYGVDITGIALGVLVLGFIAEGVYFFGLRGGWIKSNLVPKPSSSAGD